MATRPGVALYLSFFTALFLVFYAESILRQATVSNLDSSKLNLNRILDNLPAPIRDRVKHKMEMIKLREAVLRAATEQQKIVALSNLAYTARDDREKDVIYGEIIRNYPASLEAYQAYLHFLLHAKAKEAVSLAGFQGFIGRFPNVEQLQMWQAGLSRLTQLKVKPEIKLEFLLPLLDQEPEVKDYLILYKNLGVLAKSGRQSEYVSRAEELQNHCLEKPSYEAVTWERMMAEDKAKATRKGKMAESAGAEKAVGSPKRDSH